MIRGWIVLVVVALATGCFDGGAAGPEERAREILGQHAGDEAAAVAAWRGDPGNWRLGLEHEVASSDPAAPAIVRTERELATPSVRRCGGGLGPVAFRTDVLDPAGEVVARFRWTTLDLAAAGHARVRAALAAVRADFEALWGRVQAEPGLATAWASFRGRRDRCPG